MPTVEDSQPVPNQKREESENGPSQTSRARAREIETPSQQINIAKAANLKPSHNAVRQVVRAAARLADLCTTADLEADARVIREATMAENRIYDLPTKSWIVVPDHKTRLAA